MARDLEEVLGPAPARRAVALSDSGWMIAGNVLAALGALFAFTWWLGPVSFVLAAVPIVAAVLVGRAAGFDPPPTRVRTAMRVSVPVLAVAAIVHVAFLGLGAYDYFFGDHGDTGLELLGLVWPFILLCQLAVAGVVGLATVIAVRVARASRTEGIS